MQNIIKTVDVLPNLPSELDVVVLRPSDHVENETRYQYQFRSDFRVRKGHIITWLRFLKANHPGYRDITISPDRLQSLPADDDVSSSFATITDEARNLPRQQSPGSDDSSSSTSDVSAPPVPDDLSSTSDNSPPVSDDPPPPNTQSMVPNLNATATKIDMIMQELAGRDPPPGLPAPSIRHTPIDEASGKDHIFALAFPTLYPTGQANFNMPWVWKVALNDYAQRLLCYRDGRFGCYPRWHFFVFNLLMRRKANAAARFYVSMLSGLRDLDREELANALLADNTLLPQIVRQGSNLTGTRPFWRNKSNHLHTQAHFLS
jgi:ATP-dependent DNA helicase PIF1